MALATPAALVQQGHVFGPGYMTRVLDTHDGRPEAAREYDGYLHVSELIGMCSRQKVLLAQSDGPRDPQRVTGGHRVMWRLGRAAEAHVREAFIQARDYRGILGRWTCVCERTQYEGLYQPEKAPCPYCRGFCTSYRELVLRCDEARVKGSPDLPYYVEGEAGEIVITEIKSMNGDDFAKLESPLADHVFQAACYRRLLRLMGRAVPAFVIVLYVTKMFRYGSPYKEYHVDVSGPQWEALIDDAWRMARLVRDGVAASGSLPLRELCTKPTDPLAKGCACVVACFGRNR